MIEILKNLDILKSPILELTELEMAGIRFGAQVDPETFPRNMIEGGLTRDITQWGPSSNYKYTHWDGRNFSLTELIEIIFDSDGVLYLKDNLSCEIVSKRVIGFSIYSHDHYLKHFGYIKTYQQLLMEFGTPDYFTENESYGELMGYHNFYYSAGKCVGWDSWDERLSFISLSINTTKSEVKEKRALSS